MMEQMFVLALYSSEHNRLLYYVASNRDGVLTTDIIDEAAHFTSEESANKAVALTADYDQPFAVDTHGFWSAK